MSKRKSQRPQSIGNKKYQIGGKTFELKELTLKQDELLAPIVREMVEVFNTSFTSLTEQIARAAKDGQDVNEGAKTIAVNFSFDVLKITAWLFEKRYARRVLAVLLIQPGIEFNESEVGEREEFMANNASREVAVEVVNYFFVRSRIFEAGLAHFSRVASTTRMTS